MKLFVLFLLICFLLGVTGWYSGKRQRHWVLLGLCLFLTFAYFFLNQI